jgi:hypothetical protein
MKGVLAHVQITIMSHDASNLFRHNNNYQR